MISAPIHSGKLMTKLCHRRQVDHEVVSKQAPTFYLKSGPLSQLKHVKQLDVHLMHDRRKGTAVNYDQVTNCYVQCAQRDLCRSNADTLPIEMA